MTNVKDIDQVVIEKLNSAVAKNWINSVALIYTFAQNYTNEQLEKALVDHGGKTTKKSNPFSCAAKLGTMCKESDGSYTMQDTQASRYASVCKWLKAKNVKPADVAAKLNGVSINSIIKSKNPKPTGDALDQLIKDGIFEIEQNFANKVDQSNPLNISALDVNEGHNLMVVVVDAQGNITGMSLATANSKYQEIANDIVTHKAPKTEKTNAVDQAIS